MASHPWPRRDATTWRRARSVRRTRTRFAACELLAIPVASEVVEAWEAEQMNVEIMQVPYEAASARILAMRRFGGAPDRIKGTSARFAACETLAIPVAAQATEAQQES